MLGLGPTAGMAGRTRANANADRSSRSARRRALGRTGPADAGRAGEDRRARRPVRAHRLGHGRRGLGCPRRAIPRSRDEYPDRGGYLVRGIASPKGVSTRRLGRGEGSRALVPGRARGMTPTPTGRGPPLSPVLSADRESASADSRSRRSLKRSRFAAAVAASGAAVQGRETLDAIVGDDDVGARPMA